MLDHTPSLPTITVRVQRRDHRQLALLAGALSLPRARDRLA
jgi:hypothetical protein